MTYVPSIEKCTEERDSTRKKIENYSLLIHLRFMQHSPVFIQTFCTYSNLCVHEKSRKNGDSTNIIQSTIKSNLLQLGSKQDLIDPYHILLNLSV